MNEEPIELSPEELNALPKKARQSSRALEEELDSLKYDLERKTDRSAKQIGLAGQNERTLRFTTCR